MEVPGGRELAGEITLRRASTACSSPLRVVRIENMIWLIVTRAARPLGLPYAPRIPVCRQVVQSREILSLHQSCSAVPSPATSNLTPRNRTPSRLTSLQTICTSAGKHLVDTDDVVRVKTHADMEGVLAHGLDHVLVGGNTGSLKGLRRDLLFLEGEEVNASRERVHAELLLSDIEDLDLSLRHTTAVARFDVGLVLDVTRALPRTCPNTWHARTVSGWRAHTLPPPGLLARLSALHRGWHHSAQRESGQAAGRCSARRSPHGKLGCMHSWLLYIREPAPKLYHAAHKCDNARNVCSTACPRTSPCSAPMRAGGAHVCPSWIFLEHEHSIEKKRKRNECRSFSESAKRHLVIAHRTVRDSNFESLYHF
jgi:hypothetical protein